MARDVNIPVLPKRGIELWEASVAVDRDAFAGGRFEGAKAKGAGSVFERVWPRRIVAVSDVTFASGAFSVGISALAACSYDAKAVGVDGPSAMAQVTSPGSVDSCAEMLVVPTSATPNNMQPNAMQNRITSLANDV
jgi:hypothetical protein